MVKFQTDSWTTTVQNSLEWEQIQDEEIKVKKSKKKLKQVNGDQLLTELLQIGDKKNVKLSDYINQSQSDGEGTLPDFWNKITSGDLDFTYIENVDLPKPLVKNYELKWNFDTETFIQEIVEGPIAGITKPTYYFGRKYAAFAFHREDADLRSLSYLIAGSPKVCYNTFTFYISITSFLF